MESNKEEFLEATNTDLFNSFTVILKSSILKKAFFLLQDIYKCISYLKFFHSTFFLFLNIVGKLTL